MTTQASPAPPTSPLVAPIATTPSTVTVASSPISNQRMTNDKFQTEKQPPSTPPTTRIMEEQPPEEDPPADVPLHRLVTSKWKSMMDSLRNGISHVILRITHRAAANPIAWIVAICVFSFSILGIGFVTNFDMNVKGVDSYTVTHSVIWEQRAWLAEESNFPAKPYSIRLLIHRGGDNVVSQEGVLKTFEVVDHVHKTQGYDEHCQESLESNTAGYGGLCHIRGMPLLWNHSRTIFEESVSSNVDLLLQISADQYPDGSDIDRRELMGHETFLEGTVGGGREIIETAESFLMEIAVPGHSRDLTISVLDDLLDLRKEWMNNGSGGYQLEMYLLDYSLETETVRAVFADLPLIPSVFVIMALFTCLVFSLSHKPGSKIKQRFLLGFGAVATVLMSMATSYGFLFVCGVPFTSLTQILPFIMFGIGLDDAFVIFGEFVRTDETKDPVDRITDTFEEVGLSIFLTTLTTSMAFALGCFASIPALIWVSLYAFPTVIIDFFYQITFFVAIIVIDERRVVKRKGSNEASQEHGDESMEDAKDDHKSDEFCPGHESEEVVEPITVSDEFASQSTLNSLNNDRETDQVQENLVAAEQEKHYHHHTPGPPASGMDRFMKRYADVLLTKPARIIVLLGFVAVTVLGAISTSQFTQEFNIYEVLMTDSYVAGFFKSMDEYAESGFVVPKVYFRNVDQSDPEVQQQMFDFVGDLVNETDSITRQPPFFWLTYFNDFLTYDDRLLDLTFNQQMDIFLSIDVFRQLFGDHIVRDENGNVTASRVVIFIDDVDVEDVQDQISVWREQLDVTETQPINVEENRVGEGFNFFVHDEVLLFTWEFYAAFVDELMYSSIIGVLSVTLVAFLFLPHWSAAFILAPILSILYIDLIGFLQLCGVHLNAITYFTLVMSIGLLVDFNMHILLRYYESPCNTREAKVKDALQTMGSSVVIGGLSTFLGVVPLLFSSSSLMKTLFYGFWGMVLLGCGHGVIVLPVILSYIGPVETYAIRAPALPTADPESSSRSTEDATKSDLKHSPASVCTSVPTSVSSARPHLDSDGDISGLSSLKPSVSPSREANAPSFDDGLATTYTQTLSQIESLPTEENSGINGSSQSVQSTSISTNLSLIEGDEVDV